MSVFENATTTQTIIFVNTKSFSETVFNIMRKNGYKVHIIMSELSKEERDEMMEKFRKREINFVITTNLLARGIDIPDIELVINFDVPR